MKEYVLHVARDDAEGAGHVFGRSGVNHSELMLKFSIGLPRQFGREDGELHGKSNWIFSPAFCLLVVCDDKVYCWG